MAEAYEVRPVGTVRREGDESPCRIEIRPEFEPALLGLEAGDRVQVIFWMHRLDAARRHVLQGHPRGDRSRAVRGVFALRSPMRPNPMGSTEVTIRRIEGLELEVEGLDAFDGSPVIDIKMVART
ncbi:MAG: tRNA (N6-threonylcarbamoyladenosine(37)-N6)-methyltransferase TrmO [Candidatus Brocadiaceae bacterium]|nr:tRNA (N6-threonylcarbamoyladenosine(37)-N6)-methyltransferase TrmO [Candidatus Brocadiaceae bacterium]